MTKRTKRTKRHLFLESLKKGHTITKACENASLNIATLYMWRGRMKRFDDLIHKIYQSRVSIVEDALYRDALKGNTTAQIFFLKNRAMHRWKDRQYHESDGSLGTQQLVVIRPEGKQIATRLNGIQADR